MMMVKVSGVSAVVSKMHAADKSLQLKFISSMKRAGLFLQRESQKIVPRDVSNLHGSAFTRAFPMGWNTDVVVGYTSKYAVYVHENLDAAHGAAYNTKHAAAIGKKLKGYRRKRPEEQAKFLEAPARLKRSMILAIIAGV